MISPGETEPSTPYLAPLEDVECATRPSKSKWMQLMTVLVSGLALFSDGYNIQVTGAPVQHVVLGQHMLMVQLIQTPFSLRFVFPCHRRLNYR